MAFGHHLQEILHQNRVIVMGGGQTDLATHAVEVGRLEDRAEAAEGRMRNDQRRLLVVG